MVGDHLSDAADTEYIPETLIHENGRVGGLFASKAFVQLLVNPVVGTVTERRGYAWPLVFGTATLFLSASRRCFTIIYPTNLKILFAQCFPSSAPFRGC